MVGETLTTSDRTVWRSWLNENHTTAKEIWLVYHRAHTGIPRVAYNDAVEEAVCFGWIDSIVSTIDEDRYAQRFTPRRSKSTYSQTNRERLRRLIEENLVIPEVAEQVAGILAEPFVVPPDIDAALRADTAVWQCFTGYSEAYQRIRIAYVDSARRRPEEFDKRLGNLLRKTAADTQFGFGIESYY
ncbi:MAG: YdeI/OmpD-associated family protein [Actinomycetia bacterium]|nr:YdeI/OmpD-associated family protein [Actinomycetes bacterium]